ncbi:MAG: toxin-antitoxin system HicB family antitoxin [Rhodobacteraceae bacterium]|nr:toxin-antitoxin system HicB family antitoxin [Paracoccaceae bacterium]
MNILRSVIKLARNRKNPTRAVSCSRIDPDIHRRSAQSARLAGKSLNKWAEEVIDSSTD